MLRRALWQRMARLLLGDSFHPGGLALTERLAQLVCTDASSTVLDAACGRGTSALHLARAFGCHVIGIDLSASNIAAARSAAAEAGLDDLLEFRQADAECLPLADGSADIVICECSLCTFHDKRTALAEFARVLRPAGRLGLSDLTRNGALPGELETLAGWVACLAGAFPIDGYRDCLQAAGFAGPRVESHDAELRELVRRVRAKLLGIQVLARLGKLQLSDSALQQAKRMSRAAAMAVSEGRLGYCLITAALVPCEE